MLLLLALVCIGILILYALQEQNIINDITGLNPTRVSKIIEPTTIDEIQEAVREYSGGICVGGSRCSMGGQTIIEDGLHIDMRRFNKICYLNIEEKIITVQCGITWRDIQEVIDSHNLSIMIMQSYSNFTVGGSVSVNVHGRYINSGAIVNSVISIRLVMSTGELLTASRIENEEIFFAAIGGYGAFGIIVETSLYLTSNEKLERKISEINVSEYQSVFEEISKNQDSVLHNGDLYMPELGRVRIETWYRTDASLTENKRLIPRNQRYWLQPNFISLISNLPFGQYLRRAIEPQMDNKEMIVWRNHEASHDIAELEPITPRWFWTYALQEYFVPIDKFDDFVTKLRGVIHRHSINIINISIRHSRADHETLLSWSRSDVYSFVIYYKQSTSLWSQIAVSLWTQELIEEVLSVEGSYYLPYQLHATKQQFQRAYPNYEKFLNLKNKYDPTNKFRNKLIDTYFS